MNKHQYQPQKPLTKRQQQIFDFIVNYLTINNAPPTRAEIATHFDFKSANAAEDHLKAIAKKGYIELKSGTSRGIFINDYFINNSFSSSDFNKQNMEEAQPGLAVIGDVAAGEPILAQQHIQQYVSVESHLFTDIADFLLSVKGDSMQDIGIFEKDLLAIKKTNVARNNQIVVARVGDDVTVKRFLKKGNSVSLIAENDDYQPIEIDISKQELTIEGVVVGLIRQSL